MSLKDCIEHLYSWDYTIQDSYGCPGCAERERIIKLLESFCADDPECKAMGGCGCYEAEIALIKGENK